MAPGHEHGGVNGKSFQKTACPLDSRPLIYFLLRDAEKKAETLKLPLKHRDVAAINSNVQNSAERIY